MLAPTLLDRVLPRSRPAVKAAYGVGTAYWATDTPLSSLSQTPQKFMAEAQALYHNHLWIRAAERVIGDRFATAPWHLEDEEDNEIGDDSPDNLRAIRDLFERPYKPLPGDPITSTPRTFAALKKITCRHMGLCGSAAWYLDGTDALAGTPLQILYLNPARLTPAEDRNGNLIGWVLDADARGGGMPLETKNVVLFHLEPPDHGHFGSGLVEAAWTKVELTKLGDRHSSQVFQSGGRLAGILSPKTDSFNPDQFEQLKRDVRTIGDSPDSAKRMLILQGPAEFDRNAATPQELNLVEVVNSLGRDPLMALWGVPLTQLGVALPAGLNSGGAKDVDYEVLWANAIGPRVRSFVETLQYEVLDRYKELGITVEYEVEEPEFDDRTPLFEQAQIASNAGIPLTNAQKLALIGEEPFPDIDGQPDPRNFEVWMPVSLSRVYPEPAPNPTPPQLAQFTGQATEEEPPLDEGIEAKAKPLPSLQKLRESVEKSLRADLKAVLAAMAEDTARRVRERTDHLIRKPSDVTSVYDSAKWERELERVLKPHVANIAGATDKRIAASLAKASLRESLPSLLKKVGVRIKGINDYTRERVQAIVREGIQQGLGAAELGKLIQDAPVFDELRAETIARTETGTILNLAATESYRSFGVEKVLVYDGEKDEVCAAANGQTWTLDEAEANPLGHPSCTRDFAPIVGAA